MPERWGIAETFMGKWLIGSLLLVGVSAQAQQTAPVLIREQDPLIALIHVELIDGTGAAPADDQTVLIDHGRISAVGKTTTVAVPAGTRVIDGTGKTLIPGLVGMHEHLFYPAPVQGPLTAVEQFFSFPQLYLASGVTTARTTGSMDPYGDLQVKRRVDGGQLPGPDFYLSSPYLEGAPGAIAQMHELKDADEARDFVRYWHSVGFTSIKAYTDVTPDELRGAIEEAHRLKMKVTGHLCSVGFEEAARMGIDNLEHGPYGAPDGELYSKRVPGKCQDRSAEVREIVSMVEPDSAPVRQMIQTLLAHHVAITSTLAVLEDGNAPPLGRPGLMFRAHELMVPEAWSYAMTNRAILAARGPAPQAMLQKEMRFEREFVDAGGILMAGCDPTGDGHTLAGLGDERNIELLVDAGFTPAEAIHISTQNGATFLEEADRIGTVLAGKRADLVLLDGDLARNIHAIESPELVFKAGVGYDSNAIYDSLRGKVGWQ
jgi:imidazolonepropionase-like amidohydrolase